jgi:hypothetical protein
LRAVQVKIYLPDCIYRLSVWLLLCYRRLRYGYPFRRIPLTQGKYAIVDPEDYERIARHKWFAVRYERGYYAVRAAKDSKERQRNVRMHREIMGEPKGEIIDHINHNGLDNRKANLRVVTRQQNTWNKRKQRGGCGSKYKGVMWFKRSGKWQVRITHNGKSIFIGYFDDEKAAARAYDARAAELYGDYAVLNFPKPKKAEGRQCNLQKQSIITHP